ncbi:MAG: flavin-dependent oxidoreductase [Paracoccaceae bacterium]
MSDDPVLIAGGGIGGLATALTLHQIGVPFTVFEAAPQVRPLGVGINLQPNAVRELAELGIDAKALDSVGLPAREWALVGQNGATIHAEPRGRQAGYRWDQYSVHRGRFHRLLYDALLARAGSGAVQLGLRATGYETTGGGSVTLHLTDGGGRQTRARGRLLIGADGIHSSIRAQMHPNQPPIHWGGALMWRGTARAKPFRTGASFVGLGTDRRRVVLYPISPPDRSGRALINWIAELWVDPGHGWQQSGWFRATDDRSFLRHFDDFRFDWLDVPALVESASEVYENPMIDRDPAPFWVDGPVALLGDAAHAMYPTGSNGASQAIVDARVLGAAILAHGSGPEALAAYQDRLHAPVSALVLRNRGAGPFGLLKLVDDRCGGHFTDIETVIPETERTAFMASYKAAAGFAMETLNTAPPTIAPGARVPGN